MLDIQSRRGGEMRANRPVVHGLSNRPLSHASRELITGASVKEAADFLFDLLMEVVCRHQPEIEPVLRGTASRFELNPALMSRALQAQGIWFQLLSLAEQAAAMQRRRQVEGARGRDQLKGTFDYVLAEASRANVTAQEIGSRLDTLRIRPVITAHPTEAKRVTVLEKHRKIYLLLRELESPRWTSSERCALVDALRNQIELLWMTGELHLEKPTVQQEVAWGLHFFDETLFEVLPETLVSLERALRRYYPGEHVEVTPLLQFGSWIGGDRDGNPFVTTSVTRQILSDNALAGMRRYKLCLIELARKLSISDSVRPISDAFGNELNRLLHASGDASAIGGRNPGEPYRQYVI
jgi:phosphoenolpyruvate carboxylase